MSVDDRPILRLGHSPDPDDAFMWWPLFELNTPHRSPQPPRIDTGRFRFVPVTADIETLNHNSCQMSDGSGKRSSTDNCLPATDNALEITAISCAQYPHVQDRYALTSCGASMGENYGPKLIAREPMSVDALRIRCRDESFVIAVPGVRTSAFATLSMLLGKASFRYAIVPFEQIIDRVMDGSFSAGVVIHEGQLTFGSAVKGQKSDVGWVEPPLRNPPLHLVQDLGAWWWQTHRLPLPLGVNVIRRDLEQLHGPGTLREVTTLLRQSVEYALAHREESIAYAMQFARGIPTELADEFVRMYVNKWTLDFGDAGRSAVKAFLHHAHQSGVTPAATRLDFIEPNEVIAV